jgi:diacylglycerol kinase (ATP)
MAEKWVFIVNPVAGNGSAKSQLPSLEEMIRKYSIDAEIVFTRHKDHAAEFSEAFLGKGFRYFIGVGGDGTINEIARPLIGKPGVILGLIPAGTGNDFIQILGFPNRFGEREWDIFFQRDTTLMDIGIVNGMIFLNGMGLGFDAQVASENYTEKGEVKEGAKNRYIWHIIKTLLFFREKRMRVITENGMQETDCFINTIANGRRFAGGFLLTPKAIANDGLLDVCSIKKLSLPERFQILLKVPKGKHINDRRINYYQTSGLNLDFPSIVPFHVDGELYFSDKFEVSIVPSGLNMIYNQDGPHFFRKYEK